MTMEFLFVEKNALDATTLHQGDILSKTPALIEAVGQAHSYYANAANYTHFMVLTQSCDLVLRDGKRQPKSPYITLAAVRPLSDALDRRIDKHRAQGLDFPIRVCDRSSRTGADQFLERLLHNTEDGLFFIRAGSAPTIVKDSCVFLALSIALRVEHYSTCLDAKVAQLSDIFAAKVGWMAGNQYSRVGTPDLEDKISNPAEYAKRFAEQVLHSSTMWLSPAQIDLLKKDVKKWKGENRGQDMTAEIASSLLDKIPKDVQLVVERIMDLLDSGGFLGENHVQKEKAKRVLANDKALERLIINSG